MLATIGHFLAVHAIAMLMLSVGLRTDRAIVRVLGARWKLLLRELAVVWIAVPLLALVVIYTLQTPPIVSAVLMIMAICPGIPLVLHKAKTRGDAETSLMILIATALTAVVMVPVWGAVLSGTTRLDLDVDVREVLRVIIPMVLLPYVVGRLVNEVAPRVAAPLAKIASALFIAGILILAAVVIIKVVQSREMLQVITGRGLLAAFIIPLAAAVLGYVAARAGRRHRVSMGYAAALGNPALALAVIVTSNVPVEKPVLLAMVGLFVLIRAIALVPFGLWLKREDRPRAPDDLAHAHGN